MTPVFRFPPVPGPHATASTCRSRTVVIIMDEDKAFLFEEGAVEDVDDEEEDEEKDEEDAEEEDDSEDKGETLE